MTIASVTDTSKQALQEAQENDIINPLSEVVYGIIITDASRLGAHFKGMTPRCIANVLRAMYVDMPKNKMAALEVQIGTRINDLARACLVYREGKRRVEGSTRQVWFPTTETQYRFLKAYGGMTQSRIATSPASIAAFSNLYYNPKLRHLFLQVKKECPELVESWQRQLTEVTHQCAVRYLGIDWFIKNHTNQEALEREAVREYVRQNKISKKRESELEESKDDVARKQQHNISGETLLKCLAMQKAAGLERFSRPIREEADSLHPLLPIPRPPSANPRLRPKLRPKLRPNRFRDKGKTIGNLKNLR